MKKKYSTIVCSICALLSLACIPGIPVLAEEKVIEVLPIDPLTENDPQLPQVPEKFDGKGSIDRIDKMEIVIGDRLQKLAYDTRYFSIRGKELYRGQFKKGDIVGYIKNKNNTISILYKMD